MLRSEECESQQNRLHCKPTSFKRNGVFMLSHALPRSRLCTCSIFSVTQHMPAYPPRQLHLSTEPNTTSTRAAEVMARPPTALLSQLIQLIQVGDKSSHTRAVPAETRTLPQPAGASQSLSPRGHTIPQ